MALKNGDLVDVDWQNNLMLAFGLSYEIKREFPCMADLAPTQSYISAKPFYLFGKGIVDPEPIDVETYFTILSSWVVNFMSLIEQNDVIYTGDLGILATLENSYFGIGSGQRTPTNLGIIYTSTNDYAISGAVFANGDGTVPQDSTTMMNNLDQLGDERVRYFNSDHTGTGGGDKNFLESIDWVINVLKGEPSNVKGQAVPYRMDGYLNVFIACPVDVTITNGAEKLAYNSDLMKFVSNYGELYILGENQDIKLFNLDEGDYQVEITGTDTGTMDMSVEYYNSESELQQEIVFSEVPVTEDTVITTDVTQDEVIILFVDEDGDGIVDYEVYPNDYEDDRLGTPIANPPGGQYEEPVIVTLESPDGVDIYYTLDCSLPNANSALYEEEISIEETTTIKAVAIKDGYTDSYLMVETYVINDDDYIPVENIRIQETALSNMGKGKTKQLTVEIIPSDATDQSVTWVSSTPSILTVDENGLVTAHKVGTAMIWATASNGKSHKITIRVAAGMPNN